MELAVISGNVTLRVRAVGPSDASNTVITVHGGPGLSLETVDGLEHLATPARRVVGYDQRGSGRSTAPPDAEYGLDAQLADLDAVRTALDVDEVQLIGQSWGGVIAAAYAAASPDNVSALVLIGAIPLDRDEFLAGQRRFRERVTELQALGLIPEPLPATGNGSCLAAFQAVLPAYLADPRSRPGTAASSCTAATARATYEAFLGDESLAHRADQLRRFRRRALLVMGESDPFGSGWLARNEQLLAAATVETVVVEAAGHLVVAERPDAVLPAIENFLDR